MTEIRDHVSVVKNARLVGRDGLLAPADIVDIHLQDGLISDIAPAGALRAPGAAFDADGAVVVPGMWDHHVHVTQWALSAGRVDVGAATSAGEAVRRAMTQEPGDDGRRVAVGYRDVDWDDAPSASLIDTLTDEVPTYLVNADLHSVWMNSAAFSRESIAVTDDFVLREEPAFEVNRRLNDLDESFVDAAVRRAGSVAASRGIVGIIDFDMVWNYESWQRRIANGYRETRIEFSVYPADLERAIELGLKTGEVPEWDQEALTRIGRLKVITDGSLGTQTAACSCAYEDGEYGVLSVEPALLTDMMRRASLAGLECAIHAIGDRANEYALNAFAATGAAGSIEHAQLVAAGDIPRFARLDITASLQPHHAVDDRDAADTVWLNQTGIAYPLQSLLRSGANITFGSDAPVARLNPWETIGAAVHRTDGTRQAWREHEAIDVQAALDASTDRGTARPAAIAPGESADLVVVDRDPFAADAVALRQTATALTLRSGEVTFVN